MRFHETIKYIRIKLNLTQKDIYEGIVSQSTYSRFENGLRILPIEDIEIFANRLGMQLSDVYTIQKEQDNCMTYIVNQTKKCLNQKNDPMKELNIYSLEHLFQTANEYKNSSLEFLRYFYLIRQHFHKFSPNIPKITSKNTDRIYFELKKRKLITRIHHQFIIDFTVHFSDEQILDISNFFKEYDFNQLSSFNSQYSYQLPEALSNLADSSIDRASYRTDNIRGKLLDNANELLSILFKYQNIKYSSDHVILYKASKYRYDYYIADNEQAKASARQNLEDFLEELKYYISKAPVRHIYAEGCIPSVENTLAGKLPLKEINYIIT
ncbi:hypothetical protein EMQU_2930 (plasmid) [Enterococcus mundtii QU 25]|nr:hypothetical protein EMQU_2930 [Enterococcus mundtii QU 25]